MSVLTNSDLWKMVKGAGEREPTEFIWLQVLKRGILRRKYASVAWHRILSLERVVYRVINGEIADVDDETVDEARRIGLRISSLSPAFRHNLGECELAFVELGTGVRRSKRRAPKAAGQKGE